MGEKGVEDIVKDYLLSSECPKEFQREIDRERRMLKGEEPTYRFLTLVLPILSTFLTAVAMEVAKKQVARLTEDAAARVALRVRKRFLSEKALTEDEKIALEKKLLSEEETKRFGRFVYYSLAKKPSVSYSELLGEIDREVHEYVLWDLGIDASDVPINICDLPGFINLLYEGRTLAFDRTEIYRMLDEGDMRVKNFLSAFTDPNKGVVILVDPERADDHPEFLDFFLMNRARLANILAHEKYGHGFFLNQTTLGRTLASYGFFKREVAPSLALEDVGRAILSKKLEPLYYSSLIPSEGFAVWLQDKVLSELLRKHPEQARELQKELSEMFSLIGQTGDPFSRDKVDYFEEFFSGAVNPYNLGFKLCSTAETRFGAACVVRALEIAANVQFGLDFRYASREEILFALKNDQLRCDKRFEKICYLETPTNFVHNSIRMFENLVKRELGYSIPKRIVTITD